MPQKNTCRTWLFVVIKFNWVCLDMWFLCCWPPCVYTCQYGRQALFPPPPCSLHLKKINSFTAFMLCRLPFPIAVRVVIKSWPCCLITGLCCLVTWTKSKAYQRLLSQMLKSVFLKHPEDRNHLVPWVRAAPEVVVVFVESTYIRGAKVESSELTL